MRNGRVMKLAMGGVLAALILLATVAFRLPVPIAQGYVHLGDGVIFLAALLLGPYAALAAGIGSALADLLAGYILYMAPSFMIKAMMGLVVGSFARKGDQLRNAMLFVLAELVMVFGYFVFELFMYGFAGAVAALLPNAVQGICGVAVGVLFSLLLPRLDRHNRLS